MSDEYVAVDGLTLSCSDNVGSASIISTTSQPSGTVKIKISENSSKGVYFGTLAISVSGAMGDNSQITNKDGVGTASIQGTGEYFCDNKLKALLNGDSVTVNVVGTKGTSSVAKDTVTVKISKAGQSYVTTPTSRAVAVSTTDASTDTAIS